MKYGFWLTIVTLILLSLFIAGCIYTNNMDIIFYGLKVVAYVMPSLIGGYFIGLNKGKKSKNKQSAYAEIVEN